MDIIFFPIPTFFLVDGLARCNTKIIRSKREDTSNASHLESAKLTNASNGTAHASANFPFVEGYPFTATLWAGVEGFHMTVNGRHETSFAYREVRYGFINTLLLKKQGSVLGFTLDYVPGMTTISNGAET